jgi:hypothetical protein
LKRRDRQDAADPAHPCHRHPVWDTKDVARFCSPTPERLLTAQAVRTWVRNGSLVPTVVRRFDGQVRLLFSPADVIAQTEIRRLPSTRFGRASR